MSVPRNDPGSLGLFRHIRNYLKACLYGLLTLALGLVTAYLLWANFVWRLARQNAGVDIVSVVSHYSTVPEVWLLALLLFGLGFYLALRKKLSR